MEKKQTKKKARHAAKSWDFKFRGGVDMVNAREIAETLSRKNPVAVVTLRKTDGTKEDEKGGIIVVHHSLLRRSENVVSSSLEYLIRDLPHKEYVEYLIRDLLHKEYDEQDSFAVVTLCNIGEAKAILEVLHNFRQAELDDKQEYIAAVNYPII